MTALLLDAGDGVTHCIPVVEGFLMEHNALRLNIAGRHVTDHLVKLLFMRLIILKNIFFPEVMHLILLQTLKL
jgi:actin-related protein